LIHTLSNLLSLDPSKFTWNTHDLFMQRHDLHLGRQPMCALLINRDLSFPMTHFFLPKARE
jgi:hypothetical protein